MKLNRAVEVSQAYARITIALLKIRKEYNLTSNEELQCLLRYMDRSVLKYVIRDSHEGVE